MTSFSRDLAESNFMHKLNATPQGMASTRVNLLRILRSVDFVGWSSHEESGRLDRKALHRYASGSVSVFKRRAINEADTSAVSVMIDCSGSMSWGGGRIQVAETVAIQLAKILEKSGAEFAITGFKGARDSLTMTESGANKDAGTLNGEELYLIPFKTWGETLRKAGAKLGTIHQWAGSGTPDYSALSSAIEDISNRPQTRKIIFILTDADGFDPDHMKHLQNIAESQGIKVVAIGIETTGIQQVFKHAAEVRQVEDLASVAFNTLLKSIRR